MAQINSVAEQSLEFVAGNHFHPRLTFADKVKEKLFGSTRDGSSQKIKLY